MIERLLYILPLAYLAGSINFSILVLRLFRKGDPRQWSSSNPGVFNVYRRYGYAWAVPIFALDLGRAAGIAAIGLWLVPAETLPWVGFALICGNRYPVFHRFRGGKGVANYLGFTAVLTPLYTAISTIAWVVFYKAGREAFIGSFAMIAVLGFGTLFRCGWIPLTISGVVATLILIVHGHKRNIVEKLRERRGKGEKAR